MTLMPQPLTHHTQPRSGDAQEYHVRVRHHAFLWGSADIHVDVKFNPPLILHIANDIFGQSIRFGTHKANGSHLELGTLHPGQHFAVELHDVCGVSAECELETTVSCTIHRA